MRWLSRGIEALLGTPHQNLEVVARAFPSGVLGIPYKQGLWDLPLTYTGPRVAGFGITAGEILCRAGRFRVELTAHSSSPVLKLTANKRLRCVLGLAHQLLYELRVYLKGSARSKANECRERS